MKTKKKTSEFEFTVKVKVNLDDLPGDVKVNKKGVADIISRAVSEYCSEMSEAVCLSGDWNDNCEAIASTHPEIKVK